MHDKYTIQKHKLGNFESKSFTTKLCGILAQLGPTWTSGPLGGGGLTSWLLTQLGCGMYGP